MAAALSELLKESDVDLRKKKFRLITWTASCPVSFDTLKKNLTSEPVLAQSQPGKPYVIKADVSTGRGLMQIGPNGKMHPVAFDDRKLSAADLNYPVHEKELLATKHAVRV